MKPTFHILPLALGLAAGAQAQNISYTITDEPAAASMTAAAAASTTVVSELTTVCGEYTVLTQNGNYYTCTEAMTLIITDCPCTMTRPPTPSTTYHPAPYQPTLSTVTLSPSCPSSGGGGLPGTNSSGYSGCNGGYDCNNSGGGGGGGGSSSSYGAGGASPYPTPVPPGSHYTPLGVALGTAGTAGTTGAGGVVYANAGVGRGGGGIVGVVAAAAAAAVGGWGVVGSGF